MKMMFDLLADFNNDDKMNFINKFFECADLGCQVKTENFQKFGILIVKDADELELYKQNLNKKFKVGEYCENVSDNSECGIYVWSGGEDVHITKFRPNKKQNV